MKEYKHLRVDKETHKKVKSVAIFEELSIDETVIKLVQIYKEYKNANNNPKKYNR